MNFYKVFNNIFDLNNTFLNANIGKAGERAQHLAPDLSDAAEEEIEWRKFYHKFIVLPMGWKRKIDPEIVFFSELVDTNEDGQVSGSLALLLLDLTL